MSSQKLNLTFVVCLVFVLAISSFANANSDPLAVRRSHRMAKKRSPQLIGIGNDPSTVSATVSPTSSAPSSSASSASISSAPSSASSVSPASASASSASGLLNSLSLSLSLSLPSASSSASSASSSASSSSVSSSSSSSSSSSAPSTTAPTTSAPPSLVTEVVSGVMVTLTSTASSSAQTSSAAELSGAAKGDDSKAKTAALTTLIVVASCVGGVVILWTIFRKWKLARSSKFDQRLQPIDWQPMDAEDHNPVRRRPSDSSSFHSGTSHRGYGASGSDHGHSYGATTLPSLPDHDFTAGPSGLAPVGGYADLSRGPSPAPQMNELSRGPSFTRPNYDIGVPLHNQTGGYRY